MRRLSPVRFAALLVCGFAALPLPALGQAKAGKARVSTADAPEQEQRPAAQPLHVPALDPRLEGILTEWHLKTKGINKLQGIHRRWTFETTFQVAQPSSGKFYYEAPDRGRIDLTPDDPEKIVDVDPKQDGTQILMPGTKIPFTVKADQPEKWICDGSQVLKIDEAAKTFEAIPIPPDQRGVNIMDGPLPFLFGLPPEKAKQRYEMQLVKADEASVYIVATPLLRFDAANWQRADIMLDAKTYLPTAVKLLDPSGKRVTIYTFDEHNINAVSIFSWFGANPFKPNLFGYKQVQSEQPAPVRLNANGEKEPVKGVPPVIGMDHKTATAVLQGRGYKSVKIVRDTAPSDPKFRWRVKSQSPPPNANAPSDQPVVLTLYITEEDLKKTAQGGGQK